MYKKPITYTDYDGNERTEDFYFNLTKAEIMEWEFSQVGGLKAQIERIIASQSVPEIAALFKEIITKAYSELYMELATDADAASKFINAIIPKNIDVDKK